MNERVRNGWINRMRLFVNVRETEKMRESERERDFKGRANE